MLSDMPWHVRWHCHAPSPILGISTESNGVSPVGLVAFGDTFLFFSFSGEWDSDIQKATGPWTEFMVGDRRSSLENIWNQEYFERPDQRGQECGKKNMLFVANPVSAL